MCRSSSNGVFHLILGVGNSEMPVGTIIRNASEVVTLTQRLGITSVTLSSKPKMAAPFVNISKSCTF